MTERKGLQNPCLEKIRVFSAVYGENSGSFIMIAAPRKTSEDALLVDHTSSLTDYRKLTNPKPVPLEVNLRGRTSMGIAPGLHYSASVSLLSTQS